MALSATLISRPAVHVPWNQTNRCSPLGREGLGTRLPPPASNKSLNCPNAHTRTHSIATSLPAMSCQPRDSPGSGVVLPDYPSDVSVRPNFSGGAYVMWNPVR